ncbi:MCE family protein [Mycolicibacterium austroafricanum]|uniref:MCE family protein n=1 Tax=Mycolicibacterium austroafricanum TaxID=39687 RepID=UPI0006883C98|nr:MCE family protein [Mycolicibacterium austroafricanum]QZY47042.1 MCE family protein [Mycolicibacterium austroafricanum]
MSTERKTGPRIASEWLALALIVTIVGLVALCVAAFNRDFSRDLAVTLTADRSGLVMEPNSKVKMRGVQVGHVATIAGGGDTASITLKIDRDQVDKIPANVEARINATSLFGSKYVDLIYPDQPSPQRIAAGTVLRSLNTTLEVNTVFQNLVTLLDQIDPAKLNSILSAVNEAVSGKGERIGQATEDTNVVLTQLIPRTDTVREDLHAVRDVADVYSGAAQNLISVLDAVATTSTTVSNQAQQVDALLVGVAGLSRSGVELLGPSKDNLIRTVNLLEPTTNLLMKYNPSLTCMLVGAKTALDDGLADYTGGANGKSLIMDAALLFGDDPYRYPANLPINAAKGGPGGKPGCGSLPDVAKNWPVRALIANTGFGTGLDLRPNPGIGFPGLANYFPVTKAIPEPPRIRYPGGPAPGPIPYPGAPPYGAPLYGPDGTPLYPGVPPAPPAPEGPQAVPDAAAPPAGN